MSRNRSRAVQRTFSENVYRWEDRWYYAHLTDPAGNDRVVESLLCATLNRLPIEMVDVCVCAAVAWEESRENVGCSDRAHFETFINADVVLLTLIDLDSDFFEDVKHPLLLAEFEAAHLERFLGLVGV